MGDLVKRCEYYDTKRHHVECMVKKGAPLKKIKDAVAAFDKARKASHLYPASKPPCPRGNLVFSGFQHPEHSNLIKTLPGYEWRGFMCLNKDQRRTAPPEGKLVFGASFNNLIYRAGTSFHETEARCGLKPEEVKRATCWYYAYNRPNPIWFRGSRNYRWKTCDPQKITLYPKWSILPSLPYRWCTYRWKYSGQIRLERVTPPAVRAALARAKKEIEKVTIYFVRSSALLSFRAQQSLNRIAKALKANRKIKIGVGGHASQEGTADANLLLSSRRAIAVYKYLIKKGVARSQLTVKGHGTSKDTGRGHAANRRVEFKVN